MSGERKPRVALMSYAMDNRPSKGTALYARKLIEHAIKDDRFEWYLVHFDEVDDPLYKQANDIVMPKIRLPLATRFVRTLLFFWKYRNDRFDIIHWFQPRLYPFFWLAPAQHKVATLHGAGDITAPWPYPLSRRIFNWTLVHFNYKLSAIIGSSKFGRSEIIEHYRADPAHVCAIYLGGGENFKQLPKEVAQRTAKRYKIHVPYILDVSRLQPHKNVNAVIKAYELLRSKHPERTESLVIIGGAAFRAEETFDLVRNSPYASDIKIIEFVPQEDLNPLYSGAELFVFPSLNEGFGLPVVESFASGTPVITSNTTSLPEVAGDAAVIVDPYKPQEIADAMQRILSNHELYMALVKQGLERAVQFTWQKTTDETTDLYLSLIREEK
jgi:glycosyltransferase involved in cell wall biosynthesis